MAECIVETAVYELTDDGEIGEWYENIDSEPELRYYGIYKDDEAIDWVDATEGISVVHETIEWHIKQPDNCEHDFNGGGKLAECKKCGVIRESVADGTV